MDQGRQGNDGAALGTLGQLLKRNPQNIQAARAKADLLDAENSMLDEAQTLKRAGKLQEAADELARLLGRNPTRDDATRVKQDVEKALAVRLVNDARARAAAGDWQEARGLLDRVHAGRSRERRRGGSCARTSTRWPRTRRGWPGCWPTGRRWRRS